MRRPHRPLSTPLLAAGLATLLSCSGGSSEGENAAEGGAPDASAHEESLAEGVVDDPSEVVLRLRETGASGEIPTEFTVGLRRDLYTSDQAGMSAPEGTVLEFDPPVEGELKVSGPRGLVFTPKAGFAPGVDYTATLRSVSNGDERFEAPVADGDVVWSRAFSTPDFGLSRVSLWSRDVESRQLLVDVVFSGPVDAGEVARRMTLKLDGRPVKPAAVIEGPRKSVVRVTLAGQSVLDEGTLDLTLAAGVPLATDAALTMGAQESSLDIAAGQPIEINALLTKEGVSGHYLEIVCNDPAAGGERWYWDRDSYDGWWTSSRCMPQGDSAQAAIHISPAVEFTIAEAPAGFRIFGDFQQGRYEVSIDAGLATVDGGVLTKAWTTALRVPERTPSVRFAGKGRYLPRSAWRNLPLQHLNVEQATLTVRHVPEENLVFWLSGEEPASDRTSNIELERDLALGGVVDQQQTTWMDVGSLLPDVQRGIYELSIQEKDGNARDAARLLLTDLQLIAKESAPRPGEPWPEQIHVWAIDVHSTQPVSGTEVSLVRPSGQVMSRCRTDSAGACALSLPEPGVDRTAPIAILARKGDDLTYLKFHDLELQSDADTSGQPWTVASSDEDGDAEGYLAAAWMDRGVYRPGETARLAALLRADAFAAPDAGVPVVVKLFDPRGNEVRRKTVQTDAQGVLTQDLPFADFATTGAYRATLEVAEREVGAVSFSVEEFVPERMEVEAEIEGQGVRFADPVSVDIAARWLFGGSAQGSRVELDCRVEPAPFRPKENSGYHYGLVDLGERTLRPLTLGAVRGELGEEGAATLSCPPADRSGATMGPARLVADAAVFEGESGRTTTDVAVTRLHPEDFYLGTRSNMEKLKAGQTATIDGVVVDWAGQLASGLAPAAVEVEVFRLDEEYGWWWDDEEQSSRYRRLLRRVSIEQTEVAVEKGRFQIELEAADSAAGWVVSVASGDAVTEQHIDGDGRRYWWSPRDSTVDQTPRPRRPTALALDVAEQVRVGEDVTVSFKAPYKGRALMAIETNEVVEWAWMDVQPGAASWSFQLDAFAPNVYVSAFLVKDPHLESAEAFLPDRAYGVQSVRVEPEAYIHTVQLDVPDEVQPYSPLDVGLSVLDAQGKPVSGTVTATVAVVDEGILQLTDFESPDPTQQIFARRRLGVDSFETVGWTLLMKPQGPSSSTGGDGMGEGGRVQMVKPVALWSGPVTVKNGKAKVSFDLPGYRGKVRVMAVAASKDRMGHADANVLVRDPIVIQTTLPRFLVAEDIAQIPVFVSNMSGKDANVKVRLEVEDMETVVGSRAVEARPVVDYFGEREGSIALKEGESGTLVFQVTAKRAPAAARFRIVAEANGHRSKEELELPVQPRLPEDRRTTRVALEGGSVDLDALVSSAGWLEGADRTSFWVTTNPYGDTLTHLRYLVRYPYGCIEQTSSSTRPLLYVRNLVEHIDPELLAGASIDDMVKHGVDRVLSMQTPSGGFGYWPGASHPSEWGTAYGTHMLLDARKAGFEVPGEAITDALDWLDRRVASRDTVPDGTEAYAHYVLALGERAQPANAAKVLERLEAVDTTKYRYRGEGWKTEARYLLMAAMHLGGDHRHEAALKTLDVSAIDQARSNSWTFYSDRRRRAMMLSVYTDVFGVPQGADPGAALGDVVADSLRGRSSRYTTQEMAWGITALGKRVQASSAELPGTAVTLGGKALKPVHGEGATDRTWSVWGATGVDDLSLELDGPATAWLIATTDGVRATDDVPTGGEGLRVSRAYYTAEGQPLDTTRHKLGDTVYAKVTIENRTSSTVRNIALVDRLPAGWEIENPRLGGGALPDWVDGDDLWRVDHMNLRDDRVEVFGELERGEERSLFYEVRAVTSGSFTIPDVRAEAMYDPELWARETGSRIDVLGPWDGFVL